MNDNGIAPNAKRLLWAGFMAILAAGVGFAIRGGILDNWARELKQQYLDKAMHHLEETAVVSSRKKSLMDLANFLVRREH